MTSKLATYLISEFDKDHFKNHERTISVNPVVSEVATWYEKFRNAMDYREEEVILRSAIERIFKRRMLLGGSGGTIAGPLIRELVWARYFPDSSVPESLISKVAETINLFLKLQDLIFSQHKIGKKAVNEFLLQVMTGEIEYILKPNREKELINNFFYQLFRERVTITDDTPQTRGVQVFIAVRRAYAKDDLALLRYHLYKQYFGTLTEENIEKVADNFPTGLTEIEMQLNYPQKEKIYTYIKNQIVPFLIMEDVFRKFKGKVGSLAADEDRLKLAVLEACSQKYKGIADKVKRAIIRSVIFIFFTKAVFALFVEGAFENYMYGRVLWSSIALNTSIPPILMIIVGLTIKTPNRENSFRIFSKIHSILYEENPLLDEPLSIKKIPGKVDPFLDLLFVLLWILALVLSLGAIIFVLSHLAVNFVSQGVFIFFLSIVSFISFRIYQTANIYLLKDKKDNLLSVLFNFFFMPFLHFGQRLTLGISKINIFLFIFDYIIETPFKGIFAFFEQWFLYLRTQRERLE